MILERHHEISGLAPVGAPGVPHDDHPLGGVIANGHDAVSAEFLLFAAGIGMIPVSATAWDSKL